MSESPLDDFDIAILQVLQRDNLVAHRVIGEKVGLSAPAVQRRIRRMERALVVTRNVAHIAPSALGYGITIVAAVVVEQEHAAVLDATRAAFREADDVQQCYYVTGEFDFILILNVRSMEEYEAITRRLFTENQNVRRFQTMVVMDRVKVGMEVPLRTSKQS